MVLFEYLSEDGWYTIDIGGYIVDYSKNLLEPNKESHYIFPLYMVWGNDLIRNVKLKEGNYRIVLEVKSLSENIYTASEFIIE